MSTTTGDDPNADLAYLNWQELTAERVALRIRSREIHAERAVTGRPDDRLYRRWVRSVNAEQSAILTRLDHIRAEFSRRHALLPVKQPGGHPAQPNADLEERRARLKQAIEDGGPDGLLIGCRQIFTRLWEGLPLEALPLTPDERDTVRAVSIYLRSQYGSTPVKEASHATEVT